MFAELKGLSGICETYWLELRLDEDLEEEAASGAGEMLKVYGGVHLGYEQCYYRSLNEVGTGSEDLARDKIIPYCCLVHAIICSLM
jgi:hypothetical protein